LSWAACCCLTWQISAVDSPANAAQPTLTYLGKVPLAVDTAVDQHRASFKIAGLSGITHHSGDDFIAVMRSGDWQKRVLELIATFTAAVPSLYSAEHREAGGIRAVDRDGVLRTYPLATLSIAALAVTAGRFADAGAIADQLHHAKNLAKAQRGTSFLLSNGKQIIDLRTQQLAASLASPLAHSD